MTREEELECEVAKCKELNELLLDVGIKQEKQINSMNKIPVTITRCFAVVVCVMIIGFFWYESQYEFQATTVTADGTEANAQYNSVSGNQYYNTTERGHKQWLKQQ